MAEQWFYDDSGAVVGPLSEAKMADLITAERIRPATPVWTQTKPDRVPATRHPDIARYFPVWATASPEKIQTPGLSTRVKGFGWSPKAKPMRGLHGWLTAALFLYIAAQIFMILLFAAMLALFASMSSGEDMSPVMATLAMIIGTGGLVTPYVLVGTLVFCIFCYLRFVYRGLKNLELSHARGLSVTPGGAVGLSFVPFVNFVAIFNAMRELWGVSAAPNAGAGKFTALLPVWYTLYLGGNFSGRFADAITPQNPGDDPALYYDAFAPGFYIGIASSAALVVSAVCLMALTRQITSAQESLRATSVFEE